MAERTPHRFTKREVIASALGFGAGLAVAIVGEEVVRDRGQQGRSPETQVGVTPTILRPKDGEYHESNALSGNWVYPPKKGEEIDGSPIVSARVFPTQGSSAQIDRVLFTLNPKDLANPKFSDPVQYPEQRAWIVLGGAYDGENGLWRVRFDKNLYLPHPGKDIELGFDIYGRNDKEFIKRSSPSGTTTVRFK